MSNELAIGIFVFIVALVAIWMVILGKAISNVEDRSKKITDMQDAILGTIEKKTMAAILWGMPNRLGRRFDLNFGR
jgi:hypothetical protein